MSGDAPLTRKELESVRPLSYLEGYGVFGADGEPRDDLAGVLASAACVQLEKAEVAPQELLTVLEALRQVLPVVEADSPFERFGQAVESAFDVTASLLNQDIHDAIHAWIYEWQPFMESDAALEAFLGHLQSVAALYALVLGKRVASS